MWTNWAKSTRPVSSTSCRSPRWEWRLKKVPQSELSRVLGLKERRPERLYSHAFNCCDQRMFLPCCWKFSRTFWLGDTAQAHFWLVGEVHTVRYHVSGIQWACWARSDAPDESPRWRPIYHLSLLTTQHTSAARGSIYDIYRSTSWGSDLGWAFIHLMLKSIGEQPDDSGSVS